MKSLALHKERGLIANLTDVVATIRVWLDTATNGDYVLRFERIQKPHTDPQRRLMWMWFTTIAKEWTEATGHRFDKEMVHDAYCQIYFPIHTPKGVMPGETKHKTLEEMRGFLDFVKQDALDSYGIILPNPQDYNFNQYLAEHNDFYQYNNN